MEDQYRSSLEELRVHMINEISEMVKEKVTQLTGIWSDIGINYEATRNRLDRTSAHLANLLAQMLDGEHDMTRTLLTNIDQFATQVQQLSVELAVASPERNEKQLTSTILSEKRELLQPEAADKDVHLDATPPDEQAPSL
ncbi:hypothetical protein HPB50_028729 [Hyalomma asiaticum]|nr:hypothetical protein HPB50_028729 [Hyalomma asiaticum]